MDGGGGGGGSPSGLRSPIFFRPFSIYIICFFRSPPVGLRKERRLLAVLLFAAEINDDRIPKNLSFYVHKYR